MATATVDGRVSPSEIGVKLDNETEFAAGDTTDHAAQSNTGIAKPSKIILEENNNVPLGLGLLGDLFEDEKKNEGEGHDGAASPKRSSSSSSSGTGSATASRAPSNARLPPDDKGKVLIYPKLPAKDLDSGALKEIRKSSSSNVRVKDIPTSDKNAMPGSASSIYKGPLGETSVDNCSVGDGHVCLDCFPIPDELLVTLHQFTGMSKIKCLQTVQTVIRFYKQDLKCAKYFAHQTSSDPIPVAAVSSFKDQRDSYSEYSDTSSCNESILLFKNMSLVPPQKESVIERVDFEEENNDNDEVPAPLTEAAYFSRIGKVSTPKRKQATLTKKKPIKPKPTVSGTEQFQSLIHRLKAAPSEFWSDAQNASYVFTFLRKLNKLVAKLDRSVLKQVLVEDEMEFVWVLTKFLRRERRWSIKWEIIGVLGTIAARDGRARRKMLESDFSAYLARAVGQFDSDPGRLAAYAELLTVLFTGGKPLPINLLEHFGVDFVISILNMIEDDVSRAGWALPETFVKLLLSYNLQFSGDDVYDNLTIHGITRVRECKTLTTFLVDWMETKDCPLTSSWDVSVSLHQCVIKLITDIFCCRTTSYVFSNSQSLILLRLLINSLPKFVPGDKRRTSYLKLVEAILRHCKYHYVRNTPSLESLTEILTETSSLSLRDQDVVRNILKQFPQLGLNMDDVF